MVYRCSVSWPSPKHLPSFSMKTAQVFPSVEYEPDPILTENPSMRKKVIDEDEEITLFRRVRIKTSIILPAKDSPPGSPVNDSDDESGLSKYSEPMKSLLPQMMYPLPGHTSPNPNEYAKLVGLANVQSNDLRRLGNKNATRQSGQAMSFVSTSMFSSRSNSGRKMGPGGSLSRTGEDSDASSRTGTPPQQKEKDNASHTNAFR
jgi:hypothetical protein